MGFGIDFGSMFVSARYYFVYHLLDGFVMENASQNGLGKLMCEHIFHVLFRPSSPDGVLGRPLAHFGTLLIPFVLFWVFCRVHFGIGKPPS